ncbi:MAG: AMP-binding protein [Lautropia sp.]|nr:AMP-binding protein [Lautropia sp.]
MDELLLPNDSLPGLVAVSPPWSRQDFVRQALTLSARLQTEGMACAALYFDDAAAFACAYLACAHAGVSMVVAPNLGRDNLSWASKQASVWLTDQDALPVGLPCWHLGATASINLDQTPANAARLKADTPLWLKTSGSSGEPKLICKTVEQFQTEATAIAERSLPDAGMADATIEAVIGSVSTQHLYGMSFRIMLSLCAGWPIFRQQCIFPETLLESSLALKRVIWMSSPTLLRHLADASLASMRPGQIAGIFSAGGKLDADVSQRLKTKLGCWPLEIYGSTETGVIAYRQGNTSWQIFPSARHGVDQRGTLWINSPWSDGLQQTADVVTLDQTGFQLLGRYDRIIKLADKRISLDQVEQTLMQHDWISDAFCNQHAEHGRINACVALSHAGIDTFREKGRSHVIGLLKQHLGQHFDAVVLPRRWRFVSQLPRNSQGKLPRADTEALMKDRPDTPTWAAVPPTAPGEHVFEAEVPLDLIHFGGHFANFPLVPGMVELDWAIRLARSSGLAAPEASLRQVEVLKFKQFLKPADRARLSLKALSDANKLAFSLHNEQGECASGRLVFAPHGSVAP